MSTVRVVQVSNKLVDRRQGRHEVVQIQRTPSPFQRKQWWRASLQIKPATFTQKAVVEEVTFFGSWDKVTKMGQTRWPFRQVSYTGLAVTAAKREEAPPADGKAE